MKLLDKIMRLFGYENIENIHIYRNYKEHPPRKVKMAERTLLFKETGKLKVPIVINLNWLLGNWYLVDGYTSYLIAKENNIKYVKVVRV